MRNVLLVLSCAACVVLALSASGHAQPAVPQPPDGAAAYEATPRPTDGENMVLTVRKLREGFDPPRPLLIWAIGSSFTNGLGNGDRLKALIAERFPDAPEIVYRKQAGSSTSYHFCRGWAQHLVIPDQPDVVLIYNFGNPDDLEQLIVELRRGTTADIIVGTLHWVQPQKGVWPDPDAPTTHQDFAAMREMSKKYGVEFVENRRELTEYMLKNNLVVDDLLGDSVHQTRFAADCTVQNIARHFHAAARGNDKPEQRERRVGAASDAVKLDGAWSPAAGGATRQTNNGRVSLQFTGNRIDLIGRRRPDGGKARVLIDGIPAGELPVFHAGYVQPAKENALQPPMAPRDRSPHRVDLGPAKDLVPQEWTITMTSDEGNYELTGSVTGADGRGNAFQPFTSVSGQILIDPAFWRAAKTNRTGDRFTFEVYRSTVGEVDFAGPESEHFRIRLAQALSNATHTLELIAAGDGPIEIVAFDVFEPPLK
ncbi:MAG: SGNH/GDSL hydrolase family protein [Thermoguttaceae bacterium]|nr:SGNH/GDSL hydrolase family protein [Thermoguttaceae bacterium]